MKAKWSIYASSPIHPLLFAAFPVLLLWSQNLDQGVTLSQALPVLAAAMSFSVVVLLLLRLLLKDWSRSAVAASVVTILFLNSGRVGDLLGVDGGPPEALIVAGLFVISLAIILAVRRIRPPETLTRTFNVIGLLLVVLNVVPIVAVQRADADEFRFPSVTGGLEPSASGPQRDVYYLIFDRYAGLETLSDIYGFDNSGFYDWLSGHGFDVVEGALANYPGTSHSLASSLNMSYLDDLGEHKEWTRRRGRRSAKRWRTPQSRGRSKRWDTSTNTSARGGLPPRRIRQPTRTTPTASTRSSWACS